MCKKGGYAHHQFFIKGNKVAKFSQLSPQQGQRFEMELGGCHKEISLLVQLMLLPASCVFQSFAKENVTNYL